MLFAEIDSGNMPVWAAALIAIATAVGGSLLKPAFDFIIKRKEQDAGDASSTAKREMAVVKQLRERVDTLEAREAEREASLKQERKAWLDAERECRKEVTSLTAQVAAHTSKLAAYEAELTALRTSMDRHMEDQESLRKLLQRSESRDKVAVIQCGGDGIITSWNTEASEMFGWLSAEAIGKLSIDIVIAPEYLARHHEAFNKAVKAGSTVGLPERELYAITRVGSLIKVKVSANAWKDQNGDMRFAANIRRVW